MLEPKEFTTLSGKKLIVNIANFEQSYKLIQALMRCAKRQEIDLNSESFRKFDISKLNNNPALISLGVKLFLDGLTDTVVTSVFWEMAQRCSWDGLKITPELFNNQLEARQDFFQVEFTILRENVLPFFPFLRTELAEMPK